MSGQFTLQMKGSLWDTQCRPDERVWSAHNVMMRAVVTTCYMIVITLIACLIPFFGCALRHLCLSVMCQCEHITYALSVIECT